LAQNHSGNLSENSPKNPGLAKHPSSHRSLKEPTDRPQNFFAIEGQDWGSSSCIDVGDAQQQVGMAWLTDWTVTAQRPTAGLPFNILNGKRKQASQEISFHNDA